MNRYVVANDSTQVKGLDGIVYDLQQFNGRRIRWTKRIDAGILVSIETNAGLPGLILLFDSVAIYEKCRKEGKYGGADS